MTIDVLTLRMVTSKNTWESDKVKYVLV